MADINEHRAGTYTEPFTHTQYGVFTTTKDGAVKFITAQTDKDYALLCATNYYEEMNQYVHNDMDMTEIDRFFVRTRPVTYGVWDG